MEIRSRVCSRCATPTGMQSAHKHVAFQPSSASSGRVCEQRRENRDDIPEQPQRLVQRSHDLLHRGSHHRTSKFPSDSRTSLNDYSGPRLVTVADFCRIAVFLLFCCLDSLPGTKHALIIPHAMNLVTLLEAIYCRDKSDQSMMNAIR